MTDLDLLMSRIEEINAKAANELSPEDIDLLITYHRHQRARKAAGEKVTKPKVDISQITQRLVTKANPPAVAPGSKIGRRI